MLEVNLDKFSDMCSPQGVSIFSKSQTHSPTKNLKKLINEGYTEYISKIQQHYPTFKYNHYSSYFKKVKTSYKYDESREEVSYFPSTKLQNLKLNKEYLTTEENFKIDKNILEKSPMELPMVMQELIEQTGVIDVEVGKILFHSSKIYNYIEQNLFLNKKLDYFMDKISRLKKANILIKKSFIMNSTKVSIKGIKRQNLHKIRYTLVQIKLLLSIMERIKSINEVEIVNDPDITSRNTKFQEESELMNSAKELLLELKTKNPNIEILKVIENEMLSFSSKTSEKIIEEYNKCFKKIFKNLIIISQNTGSFSENDEKNVT
jgi:hypothetical protein